MGFVGKHVYFYVLLNDDGGYGDVISITATNKNTVVTIDGGDMASYSNMGMKFYINETKTIIRRVWNDGYVEEFEIEKEM